MGEHVLHPLFSADCRGEVAQGRHRDVGLVKSIENSGEEDRPGAVRDEVDLDRVRSGLLDVALEPAHGERGTGQLGHGLTLLTRRWRPDGSVLFRNPG